MVLAYEGGLRAVKRCFGIKSAQSNTAILRSCGNNCNPAKFRMNTKIDITVVQYTTNPLFYLYLLFFPSTFKLYIFISNCQLSILRGVFSSLLANSELFLFFSV